MYPAGLANDLWLSINELCHRPDLTNALPLLVVVLDAVNQQRPPYPPEYDFLTALSLLPHVLSIRWER